MRKSTLSLFFVFILSGCVDSLNWPQVLAKNKENLQSLDGGLTNENFILKHKGQKYMVKYLAQNALELGVNHDLEFDFQNHAAAQKLSPKIFYLDKNKGLYVAEFLPGKSLTPEELQKQHNLLKAVELLKKLHKRTRFHKHKAGQNLFNRLKNFMSQLRTSESPHLKDLTPFYNQILDLEKELPMAQTQVASHNDYFSANMILHQGVLKVIDWEYAAWASPYNDLTLMIVEDSLPESTHDIILEAYFGSVTPQQKSLFKDILFMTRFITLCWYATQLSNKAQADLHKEYRARYEKHLKVLKNTLY